MNNELENFFDTPFRTDDGGIESFYAADGVTINVADILEAEALSTADATTQEIEMDIAAFRGDAANCIHDMIDTEEKTPADVADTLVREFHLTPASATPIQAAVEYIAEHYNDREEFVYPNDAPEELLQASVESIN